MLSAVTMADSVEELSKLLLELQLVTPEQLRQARADGSGSTTREGLLKALERDQALTSFQVERINKGEIAGLVLGGVKLLYRNASGSFARVYRGCRTFNGEMVGVKVLRERWSNDRDTIQLFRREGEIGRKLKHPNIVPIYDVGCEGKIHFITMEFVEGGNLRDFLKIRGRLTPPEACKYALDIARALQYALGQGMTHRDMKSTNVLMSSHGVAKLIDFGLAADDAFLNNPNAPELAQALEYSTLEKNTNAPKNDPRSDLFFLGTILYEMLAGEPPYPRTRDREERKRFSRYRDIPPVTSRVPSLPFPVAQVVDRLLQVNPALRYQSPGEVVSDLERVLQGLGSPAKSAVSAAGQSSGEKTLLLVEHRTKFQDLLRDYFSKHGFRVLMMGDSERALTRLKSNPPQCVVFFGDAIGDRVVEDYRQAVAVTRGRKVAVAGVFTESQLGMLDPRMVETRWNVKLVQPVSLRDLRKELEKAMVSEGGDL